MIAPIWNKMSAPWTFDLQPPSQAPRAATCRHRSHPGTCRESTENPWFFYHGKNGKVLSKFTKKTILDHSRMVPSFPKHAKVANITIVFFTTKDQHSRLVLHINWAILEGKPINFWGQKTSKNTPMSPWPDVIGHTSLKNKWLEPASLEGKLIWIDQQKLSCKTSESRNYPQTWVSTREL